MNTILKLLLLQLQKNVIVTVPLYLLLVLLGELVLIKEGPII